VQAVTLLSDDNQVICPECETPQSSSLPFCENCGFRIRARKTAPEGVPEVTGERVAQARLKASRARADRLGLRAEVAASPATAPMEAPEPVEVESLRALKSESTTAPVDKIAAPAPRATQANTYIEGLKAVDGRGAPPGSASDGDAWNDPGAPGRHAGRATDEAPGSTQRVVSYERASVGQRARLPIYVALWLSLTALAVLATYFWSTRGQLEALAEPAANLPARVEVPGGNFERGLDEGVRSFIMQMCERTDNEPDINCKHNRLFEGEYPQKSVAVATFEIDAGEVTVGAYQKCVDAQKCPAVDYKTCDVWTHLGLQVALRVPRELQQPAVAQTCISQQQARDFCAFAGGALPTPDQWEKAARGGDARLFPWGNTWSGGRANWAEMDLVRTPIVGQLDGFERLAPPGHFPQGKSPFGAYDMAGNAAEWVDAGAGEQATARGGAWTSHPFDLRVTHRLKLAADVTRTDVGFRCAYSP